MICINRADADLGLLGGERTCLFSSKVLMGVLVLLTGNFLCRREILFTFTSRLTRTGMKVNTMAELASSHDHT